MKRVSIAIALVVATFSAGATTAITHGRTPLAIDGLPVKSQDRLPVRAVTGLDFGSIDHAATAAPDCLRLDHPAPLATCASHPTWAELSASPARRETVAVIVRAERASD